MAVHDDSKPGPTTTISSRLLLWPRRRQRPKHDIGFVLGWKTIQNIPVTHPVDGSRSSTTAGMQRETVVCAGVLPPTQALATYRRRLANLQDQIAKCNPKLCCCLYRSLDIVALWTSSPNTQLSDEITSTGLPIITQQQRGFPWWKDQQDQQQRIHQQLVLYDPPGGDQIPTYSHFHSEYGHQSSEKEWLHILDQLNHATDVTQSLQTEVLSITTHLPSSVVDADPIARQDHLQQPGFFSKFQTLALQNSMTLLHIQQIYQSNQVRTNLSALSCLSIVRCYQSKPLYPQHGNTSFPCQFCGQTSLFVDRSKVIQNYIAKWNRYLDAVLDCSLGILVAILLAVVWYYTHRQLQYHLWSYYIDSRQWSIKALTLSVTFLEQFPAGFKLNVPLTQNMGHAIRYLVSLQQQFLESTLWNLTYGEALLLPILLSISALCGWTTLLAILMDLWRLEGLHVWLLTSGFRQLYQIELFLLSALFRLFRGRKRNLLRHRTDSMNYDAMQLLVGTIGFCICIFLWTTIMVYYTFFVLFNWLWNFPILLLWMGYMLCRSIPWGSLGWRLWQPRWFALTVHLESMNEEKDDNANADADADNDTNNGDTIIHVAKLCSVAESPVRLLVSDVAIHVRPILSWMMNSLVEVLVPRRSNQAPCSIPLAAFMEHFHPQKT